jgi:hypothetical protein
VGLIIIVITFYNNDVRSKRHFMSDDILKQRIFLGF